MERKVDAHRIGEALSTGGYSEISPDSPTEQAAADSETKPSKLERIGEVLSTGGYSLLARDAVERPQPTQEDIQPE